MTASPDPAGLEHDRWAREVSDMLAAAIARDDERRGRRCPVCGNIQIGKTR